MTAKKLLKLAPRISLGEEGISTFEVKGTIKNEGKQLRFIISGQKPDRLAFSLFEPTSGSPIVACAEKSCMFYNPISAEVLLAQAIPKFVMMVEKKSKGFDLDDPHSPMDFDFSPAQDATKQKTVYKTVIDIPSFWVGVQSFDVSIVGDNQFRVEGKTKRGGKVVAYITPSRKEGPYTRLELYESHGAGDQPTVILDSIIINQPLSEGRFSFPERSAFSALSTTNILINGGDLKAQFMRAFMNRLVLVYKDKPELKALVEKRTGSPLDWEKIEKEDKKAIGILKSIFSEEVVVPVADYAYTTNNNSITITGYAGSGGTVIIPAAINGLPVVGIGKYAFTECYSLTNIVIPDSISSIGRCAFSGCSILSDVKLGRSVSSIVPSAFNGCSGLTEISVDTLNAAYTSVEGVLFNKSKTTLIKYPARKSGRLYTIPAGVLKIEDGAFEFSKLLTNVTIPNSVARIGQDAFERCFSLTSIILPDSITSIGSGAFIYCHALTNAIIPPNLNGIAESTFYCCTNLSSIAVAGTDILIQASVTNIGASAFAGCNSLKAIKVDERNPAYSSADGVLFNKKQTVLIQCPGGKAGDYVIPESVTEIGDTAFQSCARMTAVSIPGSVTNIARYAFRYCNGLTSVTIPNSVNRIENDAFASCSNLKEVHFTGNAPFLGSNVFRDDKGITIYYLPGTSGWGETFGGCPAVLSNSGSQ